MWQLAFGRTLKWQLVSAVKELVYAVECCSGPCSHSAQLCHGAASALRVALHGPDFGSGLTPEATNSRERLSSLAARPSARLTAVSELPCSRGARRIDASSVQRAVSRNSATGFFWVGKRPAPPRLITLEWPLKAGACKRPLGGRWVHLVSAVVTMPSHSVAPPGQPLSTDGQLRGPRRSQECIHQRANGDQFRTLRRHADEQSPACPGI